MITTKPKLSLALSSLVLCSTLAFSLGPSSTSDETDGAFGGPCPTQWSPVDTATHQVRCRQKDCEVTCTIHSSTRSLDPLMVQYYCNCSATSVPACCSLVVVWNEEGQTPYFEGSYAEGQCGGDNPSCYGGINSTCTKVSIPVPPGAPPRTKAACI